MTIVQNDGPAAVSQSDNNAEERLSTSLSNIAQCFYEALEDDELEDVLTDFIVLSERNRSPA